MSPDILRTSIFEQYIAPDRWIDVSDGLGKDPVSTAWITCWHTVNISHAHDDGRRGSFFCQVTLRKLCLTNLGDHQCDVIIQRTSIRMVLQSYEDLLDQMLRR